MLVISKYFCFKTFIAADDLDCAIGQKSKLKALHPYHKLSSGPGAYGPCLRTLLNTFAIRAR